MADKVPPVPKGTAEDKKVMGTLIDFFKGMVGFDLNTVLSLATPEINDAATKLADEVKAKLPADHWLRGEMTERALGMFAARVEAAGEGSRSKLLEVFAEKASDFIECFALALHDKSGATSADKKKPDPAKTARVLDDWEKKFLADSATRLKAASSADKKRVEQEILAEGKTLIALKALMTDGLPKKEKKAPEPEPAKTKKKSWGKTLGKWWDKGCELAEEGWNAKTTLKTNKDIETWITKQKVANAKAKKCHPKTDRLGRYLESPMRIPLGFLFGFGKK